MHKRITTMETAAYNSLRDYLYQALSPDEKLRMGEELMLRAKEEQGESPLKRYTIEEIHAMIDESERQLAAGLWQDSEDMMRELEEEFAAEEEQYEYAVAV